MSSDASSLDHGHPRVGADAQVGEGGRGQLGQGGAELFSQTPASPSERGIPTRRSARRPARRAVAGAPPPCARRGSRRPARTSPARRRRSSRRRHELRRQRGVVAQHVRQQHPVGPAVGMWKRAPTACASAWLTPTKALENASPARVAALAMRSRASMSVPSSRPGAGRSKISRAACMRARRCTARRRSTPPASSAWVSASTPVSAVTPAASSG